MPRQSLFVPGHASRSGFASKPPLGSTCSVDSLNLITGKFSRDVALTWSSWRLDYLAVGADYWLCMALYFSCVLEAVE